jgi:hypothetical protein
MNLQIKTQVKFLYSLVIINKYISQILLHNSRLEIRGEAANVRVTTGSRVIEEFSVMFLRHYYFQQIVFSDVL